MRQYYLIIVKGEDVDNMMLATTYLSLGWAIRRAKAALRNNSFLESAEVIARDFGSTENHIVRKFEKDKEKEK